MFDPLDKAASKAPPTLGEGCLSRYDPDALDSEDGTDFPGAAELWEQLQPSSDVHDPALDENAPAAGVRASKETPGRQQSNKSKRSPSAR